MTFPVLSANGPTGYNLTRSLRFRSSASAYLNRTPSVAGNQQRFTWSGWVKLGALVDETFVSLGTTLGVNLRFSSYALQSNILTVGSTTSTSVYRDPSAWYHIVLAVDTTQASNNNRLRLYVNGNEVTYSANATITQNANLGANTTTLHALGVEARPGSATAGTYFDGYLAEINYVDGQQLTPSSFGSTNSKTGVWQPAKYTGTYGTNGFYLPFTNTTSTTTLGYDSSGNGNNWTPNNISLTAGSTYDSMTDVPTLTSATAANYAVLNPLNTVATLTNGNLTYSSPSTAPAPAYSAIGVTTGKWYYEYQLTATNCIVGVWGNGTLGMPTGAYPTYYWDIGASGAVALTVEKSSGTATGTLGNLAASDIYGIALDCDNTTIYFYKNNTLVQTITGMTFTGPLFFMCGSWSGGAAASGNATFGQRPFSYTAPSGFVALNTYNLPASTIQNGAAYMAATLYTGTGASQAISNAVGSASFQPDFVWAKQRGAATDHVLYDVIRTGTYSLTSNNTAADVNQTSNGCTVAFGSNGFTAGADTAGYLNYSARTYVAWNWKAGGTAVSNTNGSITSSVSANTTSGFSVATYTSQSSGTGTFGHGLGVAPSMVFLKLRATTSNWFVYHVSLGATKNVRLDLTDSAFTQTGPFNDTAPTSTVMTLGSTWAGSLSMVAYCFAAIKGFSAFGSYTGNGSTDGTFVYLGFRPRYVMFKRTDVACDWYVIDTSRAPYNVINPYLLPNKANVEATDLSWDILSNGFKLRTTYGDVNGSGANIVYAAFAENPFQNALAR